MKLRRQVRAIAILTAVALTVFLAALGVAQERAGHRAPPKTPFENWMEAQGVPIYKGFVIEDIWKTKVGWWKRLGLNGAIVNLDGQGGIMTGLLWEVEPGKRSLPEKHIYEGRVLVLNGTGEGHFWYDEGKKAVAKLEPLTLIPLPMNTWHEFLNTGNEPLRMYVATNAPIIIDLFRDLDFVFNVKHSFIERFTSDPNFFRPEPHKFRDPNLTYDGYALTLTNIVPNIPTIKLYPAGHGVVKGGGAETLNHHFSLARDGLDSHIEEFVAGRYERSHRHGPGANVLYIFGEGYTLLWPREAGTKPYAAGNADKVIKVPWKKGTLFMPPNDWYHQHFNPSREPAKFLKVASFGSRVHRLTARRLFAESGHVIEWDEEDPKVKEIFEAEARNRGFESKMPPREKLVVRAK